MDELENQIRNSLSHFAAEVITAVRQDIGARVRAVIGGDSGNAVRAAAPLQATKPTGRRRRRGLDERTIESVFQFVTRNPGRRSEQIQKESGVAPDSVRKALAKLREAGRLKTKGEKRATTYTAA
jgi:hypothetical protein